MQELEDRVRKLEALVRILSGQIQSFGNVFVFRPGGTPAGNVYASWPALMTAISAVQGPVLVQVDDSIASATVPAGTWNLNNVTLQGAENDTNEFATLSLAQNAKITFSFLTLNFLEVQSLGNAIVTTIARVSLLFTNQASINNNTNTQAFFEIQNGGLLAVTQQGGNLGDNVNNLFKVDVGATLTYSGFAGADLERNAIGGPGAAAGTAGTYTSDCLVHVNTQPGTWTMASQAANEGYAAITLANWSGTNPSSVANALDRLAAKVGPVS